MHNDLLLLICQSVISFVIINWPKKPTLPWECACLKHILHNLQVVCSKPFYEFWHVALFSAIGPFIGVITSLFLQIWKPFTQTWSLTKYHQIWPSSFGENRLKCKKFTHNWWWKMNNAQQTDRWQLLTRALG